jgi:hypothetical protein
MTNQKQAIQNAAAAIVSSRDFCGNENQAAMESFADDGFAATQENMRAAFSIANNEWARCQKAAGVTAPIDSYERAEIERIFERAG